MKRKRSHHACASIKDNNDQVTKVLVVGGWDDVDLNSTELLDLDSMKFVYGPDLPTAIESPSVVVSKSEISSSSVYIIGGYSKTNKLAGTQLSTIYYSSSDFEGWQLIGHTSRKRTLFTAVALPSNFFPYCDSLRG